MPVKKPVQSVESLSTPKPRMLYPRAEAAYQLGISLRSLCYNIDRGEIKTRRVARRVLIPHAELVRFSRMDHIGNLAS